VLWTLSLFGAQGALRAMSLCDGFTILFLNCCACQRTATEVVWKYRICTGFLQTMTACSGGVSGLCPSVVGEPNIHVSWLNDFARFSCHAIRMCLDTRYVDWGNLTAPDVSFAYLTLQDSLHAPNSSRTRYSQTRTKESSDSSNDHASVADRAA
jgi:hypothetical protein